jgi:hypothetical protein
MVRRRSCAVSNHERAAILRDAAKRPLLRMRVALIFVMAGLDPAIHLLKMDTRVKPAYDGWNVDEDIHGR